MQQKNPLELLSTDPIELSILSLKSKLMMLVTKLIQDRGYESQRAAAKDLGTSQTQISSIMTGAMSKISIDVILRILGRLGHTFETALDLTSTDRPIRTRLKSDTKREILHVRAGDENWEPSLEELECLCDMVMQGACDPEGATLITRQGVEIQIEEVEEGNDLRLVKITSDRQDFDGWIAPAGFTRGEDSVGRVHDCDIVSELDKGDDSYGVSHGTAYHKVGGMWKAIELTENLVVSERKPDEGDWEVDVGDDVEIKIGPDFIWVQVTHILADTIVGNVLTTPFAQGLEMVFFELAHVWDVE
jgi:predicted XRE-type DNA-binding protein